VRDYGEDTKTIWGGDKDCEHRWDIKKIEKLGGKKGYSYHKNQDIKTFSGFCQKCGAWYGQLGLEPTLDLYIEHLLRITAELKRVLKKSGVIFINFGTSYSNGKAKIVIKEWKD